MYRKLPDYRLSGSGWCCDQDAPAAFDRLAGLNLELVQGKLVAGPEPAQGTLFSRWRRRAAA